MTLRADFTSQEYLRNPAGAIEKLRAAGPVVEVRFPFVGTVWTTTTQDLANQVLRDSERRGHSVFFPAARCGFVPLSIGRCRLAQEAVSSVPSVSQTREAVGPGHEFPPIGKRQPEKLADHRHPPPKPDDVAVVLAQGEGLATWGSAWTPRARTGAQD